MSKKYPSRVIDSMVPPGGWQYPVPNAPAGTPPLRADTWDALIKALIEYRMANLQGVGDPVGEIEAWMCQTFPLHCHSVPGAIVTTDVQYRDVSVRAAAQQQTVMDRMIYWMERQLSGLSQDAIVMPDEAQRRADVCMNCPMNVVWETGCPSCTDNVNRLSKIIRNGQDLVRDKKLKACACFGHENRAAVWLTKDRIDAPTEAPPAECWMNS